MYVTAKRKYRITEIIAGILSGLIVLFIFTGCATVQKPDQSDGEYMAYEAGLLLGQVHMIFTVSGLESDEVQEVMDAVFTFVAANPDETGTVLDNFVRQIIDSKYADRPIEQRNAYFGLYRFAKLRLLNELTYESGAEVEDIISAFRKGLYEGIGAVVPEPEETPPSPEEVDELLSLIEGS